MINIVMNLKISKKNQSYLNQQGMFISPLISISEIISYLGKKYKLSKRQLTYVVLTRELTRETFFYTGLDTSFRFWDLKPMIRQYELFTLTIIEDYYKRPKVMILEDSPKTEFKEVKTSKVIILND